MHELFQQDASLQLVELGAQVSNARVLHAAAALVGRVQRLLRVNVLHVSRLDLNLDLLLQLGHAHAVHSHRLRGGGWVSVPPRNYARCSNLLPPNPCLNP